MTGSALRLSDERLALIGDGRAFVQSRLVGRGCLALPALLLLDPVADVLPTLDESYRLVRAECPDGIFHGLEATLHAHVEYCEAAASKLTQVVRDHERARAGQAGRSSEQGSSNGRSRELVAELPAVSSPTASVHCGPHVTHAHAAPLTHVTHAHAAPLTTDTTVEAKVDAYLMDAGRWAALAAETARLIGGDDSPLSQAWAEAVRDGFWNEAGRRRGLSWK